MSEQSYLEEMKKYQQEKLAILAKVHQDVGAAFANFQQLEKKYDATVNLPIADVHNRIQTFYQTSGLNALESKFPKPDDKDFDAKIKPLQDQYQKLLAEKDKELTALVLQEVKFLDMGAPLLAQIKSAAATLSTRLNLMLDHANEKCPICKGKGNLPTLSPPVHQAFQSILDSLGPFL